MTRERHPLLALAEGQPCMAQIPGVCNGDPQTTVCAHANHQRYGKGMSIKAKDWWTAWMCSACHHEIDHGSRLSKSERAEIWQRAFERTLDQLWLQGLIAVSGQERPEPAPQPRLSKILPRQSPSWR